MLLFTALLLNGYYPGSKTTLHEGPSYHTNGHVLAWDHALLTMTTIHLHDLLASAVECPPLSQAAGSTCSQVSFGRNAIVRLAN